MSLVRWTEPHFKSDMTPVKVERHVTKRKRAQALEKAYERVNERDGNRCWVTGARLSPTAIDPKSRREHHHLVSRSRSKALRARASNIILVSAIAHDLIERGWIVVEGLDARKPIFFHWAPHVKPEHRPFVIQRKNMSRGKT